MDWREQAEPYRQKVQAVLEEQLLPGLGRHVAASHVMTPVDFTETVSQPAWMRFLNRTTDPSVGVVSPAQCVRGNSRLVPGGRWHASGRRSAGRRRLGRSPGQNGSRSSGGEMTRESDLTHCREAIKHGSKSFYAASRLLPRRVRDPALALYAFCRLADDAVDLVDAKAQAVASLRQRLDRAYAGRPKNDPVERAFTRLVAETEMPRALPDALIEGFDWDAEGRTYQTLSDVRAYSARVASAVGAMMSVLMGTRDRDALARACDLGVAMQLTNIARDIGEDAEAGRLYLPLDWFDEFGVDPDAFLATPGPSKEVAAMAKRLLAEANRLYYRSEAGIGALPRTCRPGIYAARYIYAGIGRHIRAAQFDSVTQRARTTLSEKLGMIALSVGASVADSVMPRSAVLYAPPLQETAFLVDAAAPALANEPAWGDGAAGAFMSAMARLKERDMGQSASVDAPIGSATSS